MTVLGVVAGVSFIPAHPVFAHHSRAMFDVSKNITYRGTVREFRWQNPHSRIVMVVAGKGDGAEPETWDIEASSISLMSSMGWNPTTFKPGDKITVVAHPSRDGSRNLLLFYVILENGKPLYRATHRYPSEAQ